MVNRGWLTAAGAVLLALVLLSAAAGCGSGGELGLDDVRLEASELGTGWLLDDEVEVDPALEEKGSGIHRLGEMGARAVLNQIFTRGSERLQVNLMQMGDAGMVQDVLSLLLEGGGGSNIYGSRDNIVAEIIGDNEESREKAAQLLGIEVESDGSEDAGEGSVRVSFDLACVDDIDYMESGELSSYLQGYTDGQPVDEGMKAVISDASFGDSVSMLTSSGSRVSATYNFKPGVAGERSDGGVTTYLFNQDALPARAGVPYVEVSGELTVGETSMEQGDGVELSEGQVAACIAATPFWPASDDGVRGIASQVVGNATTEVEKVQALWRWVRYNIDHSGPMGTRYGTLQAISQKYGRCWDSSDVFITLCRASGIPARQVAGWLVDLDTGHVWSQVYLEGKGWVDVDCTSDHVGADSTYLPFFATVDGGMPILYLKTPSIEER